MTEQNSAGALSPDRPLGPLPSESSSRRRVRSLPDVGALLEQVDNEAAGRSAPEKPALTSLLSPPASETVTAPAIAALSASLQTSPAGEAAPQPETASLRIPASLEAYLPPDLWRRLNSPDLPRGVLINALERVRSVLYLLSTFLPRHLVQEKMRQAHAGRVKGQIMSGSLLFSDVSGFTALSEKLAAYKQEGAERLTSAMNEYFTTMLDILAEGDGTLLKFAGDAMLVFFHQEEDGEHARRALRVGQRMLQAMKRFAQVKTPAGLVALRMKIGVATGDYLAASVGDARRMEYIVLGKAITETMKAEGLTTGGGQLVLNRGTADVVGTDGFVPLADDFYLLKSAPSEEREGYEIHAEARRARGAAPWNASPQAILAQIEIVLRQIQAISPYIAPELVERLVAPSAKRQFISQFRPTTVLFCNFTGPEVLLETWGEQGAQRVTSLLDDYFTAMNNVVAHYGGVVSRIDPYSTGSKMLILFGAPVAHEDDTERAVSAALAMNAELESLEQGWRSRYARHLPEGWNLPLIQHRIGITVGQTYAGQVGSTTRREYTVMGDEVNLAARLMSSAEMGRILVSQQVYQATQDLFISTPRPAIKVKGKGKPILLYQVEGPLENSLAARAHSRGPLIGRQAELAQAEVFLRASLDGSGAILTLQGPAGVGKSHLADHLLNLAAARGAELHTNLTHSFNAEKSFAAWGQLVSSLARITSIDTNPQTRSAKLRRRMGEIGMDHAHVISLGGLIGLRRGDLQPEASPTSGEAPALALADVAPGEEGEKRLDGDWQTLARGKSARRQYGADRGKGNASTDILQTIERRLQEDEAGKSSLQSSLSPVQRQQLYDAVYALIERLAQRSPRVIFFEDAQWLDSASLDLLRFLETRIAHLPVLILLAHRSETVPPASIARRQQLLDQISGANTARPAEALGKTLELTPFSIDGTQALVSHLLADELAEVIHQQSLGNPFMVSEITHWFKRTHQINAGELKEVLQTSDFLQKLVLSRLEELSEGQREVARAAAVIGGEFSTSEIQALLPKEIDPVTLSNHLVALKNAGLIRNANTLASRFAFQQALVRDILYNSLPHEKRRELHQRLADHLSNPLSERRKLQTRIDTSLNIGAEPTSPSVLAQEAETIAYHYEQAQQWLAAARYRLKAGEQTRHARLYERATANYRCTLQNLNNIPEYSSNAMHSEDPGAEILELKRRALTGQGDVALLGSDYLSAITAYETALAGLPAGQSQPSPQSAPGAAAGLIYRLALALPTQGKAAEALERLRAIAPNTRATHDPALAAATAWLLWRSDKDEAQKWINRGKKLLGAVAVLDTWQARLQALLLDLAGRTEEAIFEYHQFDLADGAALASIRLGNQRLAGQNLDAALELYQRASRIWSNASSQHNALGLAYFYQAEVHWLKQDLGAARQALENAQAALVHCPPSLLANGRAAIQRATKVLNRRDVATMSSPSKTRRWPACDWRAYDDEFRISILWRET